MRFIFVRIVPGCFVDPENFVFLSVCWEWRNNRTQDSWPTSFHASLQRDVVYVLQLGGVMIKQFVSIAWLLKCCLCFALRVCRPSLERPTLMITGYVTRSALSTSWSNWSCVTWRGATFRRASTRGRAFVLCSGWRRRLRRGAAQCTAGPCIWGQQCSSCQPSPWLLASAERSWADADWDRDWL